MNPILNLTQQHNPQGRQPSIREFQQQRTPDAARTQLDAMLKSGQITQQQIHNAVSLGKSLGLL